VLLFLPGSYSTHAAWRGVQKQLGGSYRLISTSLPGYGGTPEVRPQDVGDVSGMVDFVAAVVARVAAPVHLVGHSWGGLVGLATALSGRVPVQSLITFEANPIFARRPTGDAPWSGQVAEVIGRFRAAVAAGDAGAAGLIIDYWGEPGAFAAMPEAFRNYCQATAACNLLDWQAAAGFTPHLAEFGAIDLPVTLVRGGLANEALVDISAALANEIKASTLEVVEGAGHFLISTHPQECAALIDAHMARVP
jgi:pimeloyl-ACP methyl ester carboxylesterase